MFPELPTAKEIVDALREHPELLQEVRVLLTDLMLQEAAGDDNAPFRGLAVGRGQFLNELSPPLCDRQITGFVKVGEF